MATEQERLLHAEMEARNARFQAEQNKANIEYNIMMGVLEDPSEGMEEIEDE